MTETILPVPSDETFGWVELRVARSRIDSADSDDAPDFTPCKGTITLRPLELVSRRGGMLISRGNLTFNIDQTTGHLKNPLSGVSGKQRIQCGVWEFSAALENGDKFPSYQFTVTTTATEAEPLNIALAQPFIPPIGVSMQVMQLPPSGGPGLTILSTANGLSWVTPASGGSSSETDFLPAVGTVTLSGTGVSSLAYSVASAATFTDGTESITVSPGLYAVTRDTSGQWYCKALDLGIALTAAADTTAPVWSATFTMGTPTTTSVTATASAMATDANSVSYEVSYTGAAPWSAIAPSGSVFTLAGTSGTTYSTTKLRAKDAAGNVSTPVLSVPSYTLVASADTTAPTTPTLSVNNTATTELVATATGGTDAVGVTQYRTRIDGGAWVVGTPRTFTGLTAGSAHTIDAQAGDAAGNWSVTPATWTGSTAAGGGPTTLFSDSFTAADGTQVPGRMPDVGASPWKSNWNNTTTANGFIITGNHVATDAANVTGQLSSSIALGTAPFTISLGYALATQTDSSIPTMGVWLSGLAFTIRRSDSTLVGEGTGGLAAPTLTAGSTAGWPLTGTFTIQRTGATTYVITSGASTATFEAAGDYSHGAMHLRLDKYGASTIDTVVVTTP